MTLSSNNHPCMQSLTFINDEYMDDDYEFSYTTSQDTRHYRLRYKGLLHTLLLHRKSPSLLEVSDDFEELAEELVVRLWNKYCKPVGEGTPIPDGYTYFRVFDTLYIVSKEHYSIVRLAPRSCNFKSDSSASYARKCMVVIPLPMSMLGFGFEDDL